MARRSSGQHRRRVLGGRDHRPPFVGDAEPAAQIDVLQRNAVVSQLQGERRQRRRGASQRFGRRDLRADMNVHADEPEARPRRAARDRSARASCSATPNLLLRSPVEMFGWLCASMSGFTRSATRATRPAARARAAMRSSSPADSALIAPDVHARSRAPARPRVLPTPVKTMSRGAKPARSATWISPPELASARLPSARSTRTIAERRVGLERVVDRVRILAERGVDRAVGVADRARAVDVGRCADAAR